MDMTTGAPTIGRDILYLAEADVVAATPSAGAIADAIAWAVKAMGTGEALIQPKTRLEGEGMATFFIMPAAIRGDLAAIKWLGGGGGNAARGLPTYSGIMVLSDAATGVPVALLAAGQLTAMRTAALSLLAARSLAQPTAATLGLIGAGAQADSHMAALRQAFPITRVLVASRGAGAERFRVRHAASGLDIVVASAGDVLAGSDILVSAVGPDARPFLDAADVSSGCFVVMADLGRAWRPDTMRAFDRVYTDERASTVARGAVVPQMAAVDYAGEMIDLVSRKVATGTMEERIAFLFAGTPVADLALGMLLYRKAVDAGIGRWLPL